MEYNTESASVEGRMTELECDMTKCLLLVAKMTDLKLIDTKESSHFKRFLL